MELKGLPGSSLSSSNDVVYLTDSSGKFAYWGMSSSTGTIWAYFDNTPPVCEGDNNRKCTFDKIRIGTIKGRTVLIGEASALITVTLNYV